MKPDRFLGFFFFIFIPLVILLCLIVPAAPAHAGIIDEVLDNITGRFRAAVDWIFDPLWVWYFWLAVGILAGGAVMWFFGWLKPVRIVVSLAIAGAAIYVAGGRHMHNRLKGDIDRERAAMRERERRRQEERQGGGGFFGGWGR